MANDPKSWEDKCHSSDAMALYLDETEEGEDCFSAFCFSCEQNFTHKRLLDDQELCDMYGIEELNGEEVRVEKKKRVTKKLKPLITEDELKYIRGNTSNQHNMFRGIEDKYHNFYGIRSEYGDNNEMMSRYYPNTEDSVPASYKKRALPKDFSQGLVGRNGSTVDLFGMCRFKDGGKYLLIVGGEEDCPAAFKMLRENQEARNQHHLPPVAVVSPSVGETSCAKQIQNNYDRIDKFDIIVVCMDNDEKGWEATEKILEKLPPNKVRIMTCPDKDPCEALKANKQKEFVNAFYRAKEYLPHGVTGSGEISNMMRQELATERLKLPGFMKVLERMMGGGIPLGRIINIASASGAGKTTVVNEMIYEWLFASVYKTGILSLELDEGEYGIAMLSRHMKKKINLIEDLQERMEFMESEEVKEAEQGLLYREDGSHRWMMLDEGDGGIEEVQNRILNLIIQHECKVIIIDPLSDLFDGLDTDQQAVHMRWQKRIAKKHKIIIVNILHVRKSGSGEKANSAGRIMHEEDIHGSSSIFKSGAANILFARNKYTDDPIEKNTTKVYMPKCRWTGNTGGAGEWYYCLEEHTLHDKQYYFSMRGEQVEDQPQEPDHPADKELVYEMEKD